MQKTNFQNQQWQEMKRWLSIRDLRVLVSDQISVTMTLGNWVKFSSYNYQLSKALASMIFYNSRRLSKFHSLTINLQIRKYIDFHLGQDLKKTPDYQWCTFYNYNNFCSLLFKEINFFSSKKRRVKYLPLSFSWTTFLQFVWVEGYVVGFQTDLITLPKSSLYLSLLN